MLQWASLTATHFTLRSVYTVVSLLGFGFVEVIDFYFFLIKEN
jgi:hypothetical protein